MLLIRKHSYGMRGVGEGWRDHWKHAELPMREATTIPPVHTSLRPSKGVCPGRRGGVGAPELENTESQVCRSMVEG